MPILAHPASWRRRLRHRLPVAQPGSRNAGREVAASSRTDPDMSATAAERHSYPGAGEVQVEAREQLHATLEP